MFRTMILLTAAGMFLIGVMSANRSTPLHADEIATATVTSTVKVHTSDEHAFSGDWIQAQIDGWIQAAAHDRGVRPDQLQRVFVRGGEIRLRRGTYIVRKPIDCRGIWGVRIVGEGRGTQIVPQFVDADSHKPVFDCTGATRGYFGHMRIFGGNERPSAGCAILHARDMQNSSAGFHRMESVEIEGMWHVAGYVNVASEGNVYEQCMFVSLNDHAPSVIVAAQNHGIGLDAVVGDSTMLTGAFRDCYFGRYAQPVWDGARYVSPDPSTFEKPVLWLKAGHFRPDGTPDAIGSFGDLLFDGGAIEGRGAKSVLLSASSGMVNAISFRNLRNEADHVRDWLTVDAPWPLSVGHLRIESCQIMIGDRLVAADGALLQSFVLRDTIIRTQARRPDSWLITARYMVDCDVQPTVDWRGDTAPRLIRASGYINHSRVRASRAADIDAPMTGTRVEGTR